jgi:hypothetical protein
VSGTEIAAIVVAAASVLAVLLLALALRSVTRTMRSVREGMAQLQNEAVRRDLLLRVQREPLVEEDPEPERRRDAGTLVTRVAKANPWMDLSDPVIKVLAFASGTGRAARRLRSPRAGQ